MLSFICGTAEAEKTNEIYRRAQADAENGRTAFILVPEQYSMYSEKQLISSLGMPSQSKIQILTFSRLCNLIFSKLGPLRTNYMDKAGKYLMTNRAIRLSQSDLKFLKRNVGQRGFSGLIRSSISEFKRYGVSPGMLLSASEKANDEKLAMKLRDLSIIYENFNTLVENNHSNSEDNLSLIIPKIPGATFLRGSFYINFFKSFTPTEYAVISELMTISDVCVALTSDNPENGSGVFSIQRETHRKLSLIAKEKGVEISPVTLLNNDENKSPSHLLHLKENFFSYAPKQVSGEPDCIRLLRPDNYHAEVNWCARLIKELLRKGNHTLNDFLILTGNMENYQLLIPRIFAEHKIPYFLDRKISVAENPFFRMVLSVLEISAYGFSYDRVMRLARSGYFPVSFEEVDKFENYILAADISHGQWNSREKWNFNPDKRQFDMDSVNSVKEKLLHPVLDFLDMFHGKKTTGEICRNLCKWLNGMNIHEVHGKKIEELKAEKDLENAEKHRQVWNSFVSLINSMDQFLGNENSTFQEFFDLFSSSCGELSAGMTPQTMDSVIISSVDTFRSIGNKTVIVLGAVDGIFPRDHASEGLISDAERLALRDFGITLAPDTYSRQKEEEFLVYSVISAAQENLIIFSPLSDRDGKALKPSEILHSIKNVFPDIPLESDSDPDDISSLESKESVFQRLAIKLFENDWNTHQLPPLWKSVWEYLDEDSEYSLKLQRLHEMHKEKFKKIELTPEIAKQIYGLPLTLSVSKLEKYNACAFSFFMQYGLLAQERLLGGLKTTDTGNILHSVLCDYFKNKEQNKVDYSEIEKTSCYTEISALVDVAAKNTNENLYAQSNYYKYMMMRMKSIASATAWKLIKAYSQSDFRPTGFEVSFGEHGTYPPYELNAKSGKVSLKGFIDRVDSATIDGTEYISITDYKSSERALDPALAEAGIHFQPLIYANALSRHLPDSCVAAMFYLQMTDPLVSYATTPDPAKLEGEICDKITAHGIVLDDEAVIRGVDNFHGDKTVNHYIKCTPKSLIDKETFQQMLKNADQKASETADNILDGNIDVNPARISGFDACQYCPYKSACGKK